MGPLLRWYYSVKYWPFRRERRARDGRRGLIALQIDALAYADLRRALELGYGPTLARLLREEDEREPGNEEERVRERTPAGHAHLVQAHAGDERDVARDERQHAGGEEAE